MYTATGQIMTVSLFQIIYFKNEKFTFVPTSEIFAYSLNLLLNELEKHSIADNFNSLTSVHR